MKYTLEEMPAKDVFPGFHGRFIHSDKMTHAYWKVDPGSTVPEHAHPHEQVLNLLEGEFELVLDGKAHRLSAGDVLIIPSNVRHSGRAITACRVLDVFHPVREDYRFE